MKNLATIMRTVAILAITITASSHCHAQMTQHQAECINALRDSCIAQYDAEEIVAFHEKYCGQKVWIVGCYQNGTFGKFWKSIDSTGKEHHPWLDGGGTSKMGYSSCMIGSGLDFEGKSCVCLGIRLMPQLGWNVAWRESWEDEKVWVSPSKLTKQFVEQDNSVQLSPIYHEALFVGNEFQEMTHEVPPRYIGGVRMFEYYAVFVMNPEKTYLDISKDTIDHATGDTLFVRYLCGDTHCYVMADEDAVREVERYKEWDKQQLARYDRAKASDFQEAKREFGYDKADKMRRGLIEFGWPKKLCLMTQHGEPYKCDRCNTPLGYAWRYDFYNDGTVMYFIDDKLIGLKRNGRRPLFRKRGL